MGGSFRLSLILRPSDRTSVEGSQSVQRGKKAQGNRAASTDPVRTGGMEAHRMERDASVKSYRNLSPAGLLVQPVGDGEDGPVLRGVFQRRQHRLLRVGVQVCCDLIQQQQLRFRGDSPGNGQQLPLSL